MELQYVNCRTNELDIQDLMGMFLHKGYLIINQQRFLSVWDAADPENLQKISEFPFPQRRNNMRLFGDELYVWGKWIYEDESHVHVLDVSDPARITQKQEIALQDGKIKINSLYVSDGKIFAVGLTGGIMEILPNGTVNTLFAWHRGIGDILVHESLLITKGGSPAAYGVRLFELRESLTEIKDIPSRFNIPQNIAWWEKGKSIIMLGGEDAKVIKIDVSSPTEAKQSKKTAKTGIGLCWQFVRDGDNIYVLGVALGGKQHMPAVCVIDASGAVPEVTYKQIIHEYKEKSIGNDTAKGIAKVGDYLILATGRCQLGVVRITP